MDEMSYVIQDIIRFGGPAILLFIAQTVLCLWCNNKYIRLIPTVIALGIAAYHSGVILCNLDDIWVAGMGIAYWALTALPALAAVGFGWVFYVVKLMIWEIRSQKE